MKTIKELEVEYQEETDVFRRTILIVKIQSKQDVLELIDEMIKDVHCMNRHGLEELKVRITG